MSDVCVWKVPPALTPHLSHGNDHDAFALAVGSGRPRSGSARPRSGSAFALKSHSNVLRNVGEYLSNSAGGLGLSLSLSPSLISVNLQQRFAGLSLFPPLSEAYLFPPPPSQLRKNNSRPSCVQRVRRAHLSCLAVLPNCLASRQLTLHNAASLVGEILSFHKSQFQFSRNRIKMGRNLPV